MLDASRYFIILPDGIGHGASSRPSEGLHARFPRYTYDDPSLVLEKIGAPLVAVNSADDLINPPELGIMEREIKRVKRGRYVLIPVNDETRGHGTHSLPAIWQKHLAALLDESAR